MKIFLSLSLIMMLLCVVVIDASESQVALFQSIFAPQECQRACWYGIEPGITTEAQLQQKLTELNVTYQTKNDHNSKFYRLGDEVYTKPFIANGYEPPRIDVGQNGIVGYISLSVDIPLAIIKTTWENPSKIEGGAGIRMIYYAKGIYLQAEADDDAVTYIAMARDNVLGETYVIPVEVGGPPSLSSCEGLSSALCDFVSSTFPQILRDMLLPANCTQACYFGMQPEITTRQELEAVLSQAQIIPDISFYENIDNSEYTWDLPTQTPFTTPLGRGHVYIVNGKVIDIGLTLDIPVSVIYEAFGFPDVTTNDGETDVDLIYKKQGIAFLLSRSANLTRTSYVILASANSSYETYVAYPPDIMNQPCKIYGVFPCIAPTATPFP